LARLILWIHRKMNVECYWLKRRCLCRRHLHFNKYWILLPKPLVRTGSTDSILNTQHAWTLKHQGALHPHCDPLKWHGKAELSLTQHHFVVIRWKVGSRFEFKQLVQLVFTSCPSRCDS